MLLTDLLGAEVHAPGLVGFVTDARFVLDPTSTDQPTPPARLYGLIVSPHARSSTLGYERSGVRSPWPIAKLVGRRHRGSFLVLWPDILNINAQRIELRPGYTRHSPRLTRSAAAPPDVTPSLSRTARPAATTPRPPAPATDQCLPGVNNDRAGTPIPASVDHGCG